MESKSPPSKNEGGAPSGCDSDIGSGSVRKKIGKSLRGNFGMGLCNLEAGFLSGEVGVGEIFGPLRFEVEYGGGELHVSEISHGEIIARVVGASAGRF